jgi:hypothetical protein
VGESYNDDDVQVDGDGLWGDSDEGGDSDGGRGWGRGDRHASSGWAYGHEASVCGSRYGDADADAHIYHCWCSFDCHTVGPSAHGYHDPGVGSVHVVQVGLTRSFDAPNGPRWCPDGSFLTGLDLDRTDEDPVFSPMVGQVQCCSLATGQSISWGQCGYGGSVPWGGHHTEAWCSNGYYLTEFDLLEGSDVLHEDPMDYPVVDTARCCEISGYPHGKSSCAWVGVEVAGVNSHSRQTWCSNGSFLAGLDLDRDDGSDEWHSLVVGQAYCCRP